MTIGIIPRRYGSAILAIASQENKVDRVSNDLHDFAASWKDSRELRAAFENPVVSVEARRKSAERLIDQTVIRQEIEKGAYSRSNPADVDGMLKRLKRWPSG